MLLHLWQRVALVVIVVSHNVAYSEWIKVPLKSREPDFSSFERDTMISDKMESFSLPLDVDYPLEVNHTRQMDLRLEKPISSTRREDGPRKNSPQVTKKKIVEPFSIFNFIRKIQKSFFFKSQPSVKEKVGFLERIRDNILSEISKNLFKRKVFELFESNLILIVYLSLSERRLMSLFPLQRRKKRDLDSSEHGHDFVSMDGALVTICFLTFSVFLIKLVLVRIILIY